MSVVDHPPHYTAHPGGVECIDLVERLPFCPGNAIKYLWRADLKGDRLTDLKKALWYVERVEASGWPPVWWDRRTAALTDRAMTGFAFPVSSAIYAIARGRYAAAAALIKGLIAEAETAASGGAA